MKSTIELTLILALFTLALPFRPAELAADTGCGDIQPTVAGLPQPAVWQRLQGLIYAAVRQYSVRETAP